MGPQNPGTICCLEEQRGELAKGGPAMATATATATPGHSHRLGGPS